jgi:hypothetical protein
MILVPYHEAKNYIKEADVLLFRGEGLISWLIKRYGSGVHSHAGIAHWDGDNLECVEFREFNGGRSVSLKSQVNTHPNNIDVFRVVNSISFNSFSGWPENNDQRSIKVEYNNIDEDYVFTDDIASQVSDVMLDLTGLPYGWKNFVKLGKHYLPFCRLAEQNVKDDDPTNVFVCSTAVVYAYRKGFIDPVPYLADSAVTPADLARSTLFKYQFTISKDW